jgi:hypothetical protein
VAKEDHHITKKGDVWFAQFAVPADLQGQLGKKLISKSLKTKDREKAHRARNAFLDECRMDFARRRASNKRSEVLLQHAEEMQIIREALPYRAVKEREDEAIEAGTLRPRNASIDILIEKHAQGIESVGTPWCSQRAGQRRGSRQFVRHSVWHAVPVELCIDDWLAESNYAMRTKADHRHAMSELKRWLGDSEGIRLAAATGQFRSVKRAFTRAGRTTGGRAGSTRVA